MGGSEKMQRRGSGSRDLVVAMVVLAAVAVGFAAGRLSSRSAAIDDRRPIRATEDRAAADVLVAEAEDSAESDAASVPARAKRYPARRETAPPPEPEPEPEVCEDFGAAIEKAWPVAMKHDPGTWPGLEGYKQALAAGLPVYRHSRDFGRFHMELAKAIGQACTEVWLRSLYDCLGDRQCGSKCRKDAIEFMSPRFCAVDQWAMVPVFNLTKDHEMRTKAKARYDRLEGERFRRLQATYDNAVNTPGRKRVGSPPRVMPMPIWYP